MSKADIFFQTPKRQHLSFKMLPGALRRDGLPIGPPWDMRRDPMPCHTRRGRGDVVTVWVALCLN